MMRTPTKIEAIWLGLASRPELTMIVNPDTEKVAASGAEGEPIMLARRGPTLEYWEGAE
jgi:hypothetical protein